MEDELDYKVTTDADGKILSGENFYRLALAPGNAFMRFLVSDCL